MKTRSEVMNHLLENGYTKKAINKICGFMVARKLKTLDEEVKILKGDKTFEDFYRWYYDCDVEIEKKEKECECIEIDYCPSCVLESLIEDTFERLEWAFRNYPYVDVEKVDRLERQLAFLTDIIVEEVKEEDED